MVSKIFAALAIAYAPTMLPLIGWFVIGRDGYPTDKLVSPFWLIGALLSWYILRRKEQINIQFDHQSVIVYFLVFTIGITSTPIYCYIKNIFNPFYLSIDSSFVYFFIMAVFLGPIAEEIIFRGLLFEIIRTYNVNNKFICIIAICSLSLMWTIMHNRGTVDGVIVLLIDGIFLGILYYTYKNIILCILCHSGKNASVFVLASINKEYWIYVLVLCLLLHIISVFLLVYVGRGSEIKNEI